MIIDTHAHYDDEAFDTDREALLMSMYDGGIEKIVNVCASVGGFQDTVKLMEKYPFVYGAVGIHPDDADKMTQETLDEIRRLSHMDKMVAIGEIGLDYYWHKEEEEHQIQQKMFRAQLDIAREEKLPFMIHSREAAAFTENRRFSNDTGRSGSHNTFGCRHGGAWTQTAEGTLAVYDRHSCTYFTMDG